MTYKAALAGLAHGGGKSVLIRPEAALRSRRALPRVRRFVDDLGGHYITAEDSGTGLEDMEVIRTVTKHVTGVDPSHGGSGDPSPFTALGVRRGIEACVKFKLGKDSLEGVHVAVQGVGHVGYHLCKELHAAGAKLTVADVDPLKASARSASSARASSPLDKIFEVECDVFAPCALGSALNDTTIPRLKAQIVAGAANNQLAEPRHGDDLHARGILYAPDYAINAGGLVNVAQEVDGLRREGRARQDARRSTTRSARSAERSEEAQRADVQGRRHDGRGEALAHQRVDRAFERVSLTYDFSRRCG